MTALSDRPPRLAITSAALAILSVSVVIAAAYVLLHAWASDAVNYWSVAVPGVATGVGTLLLAAVTTWLSVTQRAREDHLIREELARRDAENRKTELAAALREARKVISYWYQAAPYEETVRIVNAGSESIVQVYLIAANVQVENEDESRWIWHPAAVEDEFDRDRAPSWYRPYVLPASIAEFSGSLIHYGTNGLIRTQRMGDERLGRRTIVDVAWSDATGRHWRRIGSREPMQSRVRMSLMPCISSTG